MKTEDVVDVLNFANKVIRWHGTDRKWFSLTISQRDFNRKIETLWRRQNCMRKKFNGLVEWPLNKQFLNSQVISILALRKKIFEYILALKSSYSILPKSDTLRVFVESHDIRRFKLIISPGDTILDVRGKIFEVDQHNSCGGRLYLDSRELPYYEIKVQGTLHMNLLLKGYGCKS